MSSEPNVSQETDLKCANCGQANPPGMRFCGNCGQPLSAPAPSPVLATAPPTESAPTPLVAPPSPVAKPVDAPTINIPSDPIARERERERRLTLANVQRSRGQNTEARRSLEEALLLTEGASPTAIAPIYELIGDLYAAEMEWDAARDAYGKAHELDLKRVAAEKKFAQMTLRAADAKAERALSEAIMRGEKPPIGLGVPSGELQLKKNSLLALMLSAVIPGLGQFYNGQRTKGFVFLALALLVLVLFQVFGVSGVLQQVATLFSGHKIRGRTEAFSPLPWALIIFTGGVWLYSMIDASVTASNSAAPDIHRPVVDKTGWEV